MELKELVDSIPEFLSWNHAEKIRFFAWFLHHHRGTEYFNAGEIQDCFEKLFLSPPARIGNFLLAMEKRRPKEALKSRTGYSLEKRLRDGFQEAYGRRQTAVNLAQLLKDLPSLVPDLSERMFLDETILCFRGGAHRATIVMAWNLVFHHLCNFVLKSPKRLGEFNTAWQARYPRQHKNGIISISKAEDFAENLKENEIIEICHTAKVISRDIHRILVQKLGTRNSAAHPSPLKFGPAQAEEYVDTLVRNVLLQVPLTNS
jgi:hypothetical protein